MSAPSPAVPDIPRLSGLNVLAYGGHATVYRDNIIPINRPPLWRDIYVPTIASLLGMGAERLPDLAGVPAAFTALLRRGIANDPAARPSAAQLRDELLRIRGS